MGVDRMGFFSRLFGRSQKIVPAPAESKKKNESGITYDQSLVPKLKDDHHELLSMFGKVTQIAVDKRYEEIPALLKKFKFALQTHLIAENVRFYAYVQQNLAEDSDASSLVADLRKEMNGIATAAIQFINRYEIAVFTPEVADTFRKDLAGIGDVLVQRINTEESSLYTLYLPEY